MKSNKFHINSKSQAFSMDIMLAVIIFTGTIFFFFLALNAVQSTKTEELQAEASIVAEELTSAGADFGILDGAKVNITKLEGLIGNYSDMKKKLRIKNDFCIFLEDRNGNVIYLDATTTGAGSQIIEIGGIPCG